MKFQSGLLTLEHELESVKLDCDVWSWNIEFRVCNQFVEFKSGLWSRMTFVYRDEDYNFASKIKQVMSGESHDFLGQLITEVRMLSGTSDLWYTLGWFRLFGAKQNVFWWLDFFI